jgi:hypothetical protein
MISQISLILLSLIAYFVFDFLERRRPQDERENLISLKTSDFTHKLNMICIFAMSFLYWRDSSLPAVYPIFGFVLTSLYGEMMGKIYFRRKY